MRREALPVIALSLLATAPGLATPPTPRDPVAQGPRTLCIANYFITVDAEETQVYGPRYQLIRNASYEIWVAFEALPPAEGIHSVIEVPGLGPIDRYEIPARASAPGQTGTSPRTFWYVVGGQVLLGSDRFDGSPADLPVISRLRAQSAGAPACSPSLDPRYWQGEWERSN